MMVRIARCLLKSQKFMHVLRFCWVLVMLMVKGQFVTPTPNNGNPLEFECLYDWFI